MSERVSRTVVLCEDDPHQQLVRWYLEECGLPTVEPLVIFRNASREVHGGNVGWVLREFPRELHACRKRHALKRTLLIVVADADNLQVNERRQQMAAEPPDPQPSPNDPLVVLIPRRNIETWIQAALCKTVNENDDYKKLKPKKAELRAAAKQIYTWSRPNVQPGKTCVESLIAALPEWRKIG